MVMEAAMTGLETPQALPRAVLEGTKTYGTFLSSHNKGKCNKISIGSVSAAMMMNSEIPLFKVLVVSLAPFFNCLKPWACWTKSRICWDKAESANGKAFGLVADMLRVKGSLQKDKLFL